MCGGILLAPDQCSAHGFDGGGRLRGLQWRQFQKELYTCSLCSYSFRIAISTWWCMEEEEKSNSLHGSQQHRSSSV